MSDSSDVLIQGVSSIVPVDKAVQRHWEGETAVELYYRLCGKDSLEDGRIGEILLDMLFTHKPSRCVLWC